MQLLCKCLGGSHMYGLNTATSDLDYRGVFLNDNIATTIGLDRFEHQDIKSESKDEFYFELRHYLNSLRKTNSQAIELLYNKKWLSIDPLFEELQQNKHLLINPHKFYKSLKGYSYGERRLAMGERTGDIGSKRKNAIEKYGYSPKNFVQLMRLCCAGAEFFATGDFKLDFSGPSHKYGFHDLLLSIKTNPEKFNKSQLNDLSLECEEDLDREFKHSSILNQFCFDTDYANKFLLKAYLPILQKLESGAST